jgi:hypothetical protein
MKKMMKLRRNKKMGEMSLFASKFSTSSTSLKEYDDALRYLKNKDIPKNKETETNIGKILRVINPVSEVIQGKLSISTEIDENSVLDIIRQKHEQGWFLYKEQIVNLNHKLLGGNPELSRQDFDILDDIGDALDVECSALFKRLRTA